MFMADINANFEYDADFGPAIAQVRSLAREISLLNNSFNSLDKAALTAKKQLATSFGTNVKSLGAFQTTMVDLSSDVDRFGEALQKNKLHMRDYFKEARRAYTEGSRVRKLAVEQVRKAQSEIVSLGKDATGRNKGMVITPLSVDTKNMTTSMNIAREQFNIFNKLVQDGSRELINWGKNTQWAGRQLTVGLTIPLTILGASLSKTFRDFDKELTRFQKVYGSDLVMTTTNASQEMRKQVELLAKDIAGKFGIAVSQTAALAADLAATGLEGQRLTSSIQQTTRLAVLGEVDRQEAMKATLALQSAFNMSTQELAESIDFLNAVENQTSVSIQDLTEAIPRTGPVIKAMGGDVKDLSVLLVAMKEGGINAAEGANAIKSGMASLINPTKQAAETARGFGIDLEGIVTRNKGKLMPTILEFQQAMMGLDEFSRAQIIEQVFGKYQFARIAALFDNLNQAGSQTVEVIKLMSATSTDLANIANQELRTLTESTSMRFQRAMESIKASLLPIGEALTRSVIPFLEKAADLFNKLVEFGSNLPEPVKNFIKLATGITAIAGPIVMITGVLANFLGYVTKGAMGIVNLGRAVMGIPTKQFELLNTEQIVALKTTDLLTSAYARQDQTLARLTSTMSAYVAALRNQAAANPGQFVPGAKGKPIKRANGGGVPGSGNTDSVPALLMPGEFVVNKAATQKYGPILNAMNQGNIKGFAKGTRLSNNDPIIRGLLQERSAPFTGIVGDIIDQIVAAFDIQNQKIINAMKQFDATHITPQVDPVTGKKVFSPPNLVAASAAENNTLSMMTKLGPGGSKGNVVAFRKSMGNAITQLVEEGFSKQELKASARSIIKGNQPIDRIGTRLYEAALMDVESRIASGDLSVAQKGKTAVPGKSVSSRVPPWIAAGRAVSSARLSGQLPLLEQLNLSGAVPAATGATTGVKKAIKAKSPAKEVQRQADQVAEIYTDSFENRLNANAKGAERAGENYGKASITGLSKARGRAASMGKSILNRGASLSGGAMGAAFALNSIGAMNEGFAKATAGLTKFTNGLFLATTAMQLAQGGVGGLGAAGGKLKSAGSATFVKGARMSIASGGTSKLGSGLMMAGRGLALLGGPVGIAALAAVTAVAAGVIAYRKAISEAREAGESMYASQTAAAEYYGITLKSVNDQMKTNADIAKNLGFGGGTSALGVDPALKKAILDQEENKKLVEQLKNTNDPAAMFLGQYGKMLQQGFTADQANEILSVLAQASGTGGQLASMAGKFRGIENQSQATAAVGMAFQETAKYGLNSGEIIGTKKANLEGQFNGVIESALLSADLGEGTKLLKDSVAVAFREGAAAGVNQSDVGSALDASIKSSLKEMGIEDGPIFDTIEKLGDSVDDTDTKLLIMQAHAAGINLNGLLKDLDLSDKEAQIVNKRLAEMDALAKIDMELDLGLDAQIASFNEVKAAETARYDNLIAKNESAKDAENKRHKNFQKNIDKQNKGLEKQIKAIREGAEEYIDALDKENKADDFRNQQRQSALGGLQSLASGDVFGFLQAQQDMASNAAQFGRTTEIDRIKEVADAAEEKLQDQIDKNKELAEGEDERHEKRLEQLDRENEKIQRNKSSTLQSIDAAIAEAEKLKALKPGEALATDMYNYLGSISDMASKLPPEAQKLVTDLASSFDKDFKKIVSGAITSAGEEYDVSGKELTDLINNSIAGIKGNAMIPNRATGGIVHGPGTKNSDSITARLSDGEYVVRASAVDEYGTDMLDQINERKFASGGYVSAQAGSSQSATALGFGVVNSNLIAKAIGNVIQTAKSEEEPGNDQGPSNAPTIANYELLGQVAKILFGSPGVTARGTYPSSGKAHSARYPGRAIDYGVGIGTSVYAMASGRKSRGYSATGFGNYATIRHNDGTESLYAHLSGYDAEPGQVRAGQRIGFSGDTGKVRGAHLHFEWSGLKPGSNPPGMREGGLTMSNGLANLHKGEAVLTSPLTADLKSGIEAMKYNVPQNNQGFVDASAISNNSVYNINVDASGTNDPRAVAKEVVKAINTQENRRNFSRKI
jgi:TP901 family phage tail tape measure protein